jgi:hypothetical protein
MLPPGCRSADPDAADEEQQRRRKSEAGGGSAGSEGAGEDVSVPLITCGRDSSLFDVGRGWEVFWGAGHAVAGLARRCSS